MEISHPNDWISSLEEDVVTLLEELEEYFKELNDLRDKAQASPLSESNGNFDLMVDAVHDSAAIEGLATSRRETKEKLSRVANGASLSDQRRESEVSKLYDAVKYMAGRVERDLPPDVKTLKEVHKILRGKPIGPVYSPSGEWRREENVIRGSSWITPIHSDVNDLMEDFEGKLNEVFGSLNPIVLASWAHHAITQVHPFMDGNGRAARIFQDHILWVKRYAPAIIEVSHRDEYYQSLDEADTGNLNPMIRIVASAGLRTCSNLINDYKRKLRRSEWARKFSAKVQTQFRENQSARYLKWRTKMEDLRDAFEAGADALAEADFPVKVQFRPYPILSEEEWIKLGSKGRTRANWLFSISFFIPGRPMALYVFSFGRHFVEEQDPTEEHVATVALQLALKEKDRKYLDRLSYSDFKIGLPKLRWVYMGQKELCARVINSENSDWNRISPADPDDLAESFLRDIMRKHFEINI